LTVVFLFLFILTFSSNLTSALTISECNNRASILSLTADYILADRNMTVKLWAHASLDPEQSKNMNNICFKISPEIHRNWILVPLANISINGECRSSNNNQTFNTHVSPEYDLNNWPYFQVNLSHTTCPADFYIKANYLVIDAVRPLEDSIYYIHLNYGGNQGGNVKNTFYFPSSHSVPLSIPNDVNIDFFSEENKSKWAFSYDGTKDRIFWWRDYQEYDERQREWLWKGALAGAFLSFIIGYILKIS